MRNVPSVLAAVAGLGLVAGAASAQSPIKIAYIDSRRIIAEAPGAKEAQATFEHEMQGYQAQLKVMEDSLKALMDDYQQKSVTLSPEAKKSREDAIRARQDAYQQKATQLQQQAGERQTALVKPVLDRVQAVITQLREEGGYSIIFDVGGDGNPIVAVDTTLDLTGQVLARLNKATAAAPGPAPSAPKPAATTPAAAQPAAAQPAKKP
jgi:outer membrane protein